jgi:hypothetical protein
VTDPAADAPWELRFTDGSVLVLNAAAAYADDRYYPGCLVLKSSAGHAAAIIPRRNLLAARRLPAEAGESSKPSPASLAELAKRGGKPGSA